MIHPDPHAGGGWQPPQSGTPDRLIRPARRHQGQTGWGQQQERYIAKGTLRFEREWRQALTVDEPGDYLLPAIELAWFNTQRGRIEYARLPATPCTSPQARRRSRCRMGRTTSLRWVIWALLLRAYWRHGPRWHAFYRLQQALCQADAEQARARLLAWARLRWSLPHPASMPCPVVATPPWCPTLPPWSVPASLPYPC